MTTVNKVEEKRKEVVANKLYFIERTDSWSYDDYDSAVVCAPCIAEARDTAVGSVAIGDQYSAWVSKREDVSVKYLGMADASIKVGVVLASFNAG